MIPCYINTDAYTQINEVREAEGLTALALNEALADSAMLHAMYLQKTGMWQHNTASGKRFTTWISNKDKYAVVGENLARKFKNVKAMTNALMKSPTHRKNILYDYDDVGIATCGNVTVQMFGKNR